VKRADPGDRGQHYIPGPHTMRMVDGLERGDLPVAISIS
jgi:hypothetical protein